MGREDKAEKAALAAKDEKMKALDAALSQIENSMARAR